MVLRWRVLPPRTLSSVPPERRARPAGHRAAGPPPSRPVRGAREPSSTDPRRSSERGHGDGIPTSHVGVPLVPYIRPSRDHRSRRGVRAFSTKPPAHASGAVTPPSEAWNPPRALAPGGFAEGFVLLARFGMATRPGRGWHLGPRPAAIGEGRYPGRNPGTARDREGCTMGAIRHSIPSPACLPSRDVSGNPRQCSQTTSSIVQE